MGFTFLKAGAKRCLPVLICMSVASCAAIGNLGAPTPPTSQLALYDGSVSVAVPRGYCIETKASSVANGFAVMVACDTIALRDERPLINGFVTVQIGAAGSAIVGDEADELEQLLSTETGKRLLSQDGDPAAIKILNTGQSGGAVIASFLDALPPPAPGLQKTEWRGFFEVDGRLATVAVRGIAADPITDVDGRALLDQTIAAVQVINAAS